MTTFNFNKVAQTENEGIPDNLQPFQDDVCGIGAICKAVSDMINGKIKTAGFITAKHNGHNWEETGCFFFSFNPNFEGRPCFRWGLNESSIIPTWYGDNCDIARVVGTIAANYGSNVFRMKEGE